MTVIMSGPPVNIPSQEAHFSTGVMRGKRGQQRELRWQRGAGHFNTQPQTAGFRKAADRVASPSQGLVLAGPVEPTDALITEE